MAFNFTAWIGQVTTGHGVMVLGSTLLAVASGTMNWQIAVPLVVAGAVGLLWPENTALKTTAQTVATDATALIAAYRSGLDHGAANAAALPAEPAAPSVTQSRTGATVTALALGVAAGLTLAACANQTPAQQAAGDKAVAYGLLCLADASGKVVGTAATNDANSVKAANAAVAAGIVLTTDAACQEAIASGAAAAPTPAATTP